MYAFDGLGKQRRNRQRLQLRTVHLLLLRGDAVRGDDLDQVGAVDALDGGAGEDRVRAGGGDGASTLVEQRLYRVDQRAGGVDDVVDDVDVPSRDVADDVHD